MDLGQSTLLLGKSSTTLWRNNWLDTTESRALDKHKITYADYDDTQHNFVIANGPVSFSRTEAGMDQPQPCLKAPTVLTYQMQTANRQEFQPISDFGYELADRDRRKAAQIKFTEATKPKATGTWEPQRPATVNQLVEQETRLAIT